MTDFWRGKRVLVTGHTGFKGSWLCVWLQHLGAELCGYALSPPTTPSLFAVADIEHGMRSVVGDIRSFEGLLETMAQWQPQVVLHLAAQPLVGEGYRRPVDTYAVNVMGTVHLLEAVRQTKSVRAVVCVTSDKCYENQGWAWGYRENDPLGGADPYSSRKGCAELVTAAYRRSFFAPEAGVGVATARAGNVVGGGDWQAERLVPHVLSALASGEPALLRRPSAVRPWQHVLEPLGGYLALAECLCEGGAAFGEAWNFGPGPDAVKPASWVAERLGALWGQPHAWRQQERREFHEASVLALDSAKAQQRLSWRPVLSLEEALQWTVDWAKACKAGKPMRDVTLAQIAEYQQRAQP
jgi:CDP-glucose 4,6-dehydratase